MKKKEQFKSFFKALSAIILLGVLVYVWGQVFLHDYRQDIYAFGYRGIALYVAVYGLLLFSLTNLYGGYRIGYYRRENVILSCLISLLICNVITYFQTCLVGRKIVDSVPMIKMTAIQAVISIIWAVVANKLYQSFFPPYRMLLIYGSGVLAEDLQKKMLSRPEKYRIYEKINISAGLDKVFNKIPHYESVILCDLPPKHRNQILKFCFNNSIRTYTTPKISDILIRSADDITLFDTPLILTRNQGLSLGQRFVKRTVDIVISLLLLIIASPVMALTAIAVKCYDKGPVIYKQQRCTIHNKVFTLYKFRSMVTNAEIDGKSQPAIDNDPRITPVGKFIRSSRLDELPQLWNVLKGDMSMVGPRPERIEHVEKYTAEIPEFSFRSRVKAGLTGYAQIVGRYNTSAYDKLKMDLMYIVKYSFIEDIKLFFLTIKILFIKSSTEGFTAVIPLDPIHQDNNEPNHSDAVK